MTAGNQTPPGGRPGTPAGPGSAPGGLRRTPVVILLVVVLVAGLGYAGYRQFAGGPPDGRREVRLPGYELTVPADWTTDAAPPLTVFGVPFTTGARAPGYTCPDGPVNRGVVAGALIAIPPGVGLDQAATAFARGAGQALYPDAGPQVAVGPASERRLDTATGARVEATVHTDGGGGCRATDADVLVLALPRTTAADGSVGAAVLVVGGDLGGGPAEPRALTREEIAAVLDSAAIPRG